MGSIRSVAGLAAAGLVEASPALELVGARYAVGVTPTVRGDDRAGG